MLQTFSMVKDSDSPAWVLVGSHNLSKAAWGYQKARTFIVRNFEVSILFVSKVIPSRSLIAACELFFPQPEAPLRISCDPLSDAVAVPLPYRLPAVSYGESDAPFTVH